MIISLVFYSANLNPGIYSLLLVKTGACVLCDSVLQLVVLIKQRDC